MSNSTGIAPTTPGQRRYDITLKRRLRWADAAARMRAIGIQAVWLVIIIAGAAIPLSDALLTNGWNWVSPTLGFIIVVAAGLERIFRRTTDAAVPLDELRRKVARERRLLLAGAERYSAADASYVQYAERVEEHIAEYDRQMVAYAKRALGAS